MIGPLRCGHPGDAADAAGAEEALQRVDRDRLKVVLNPDEGDLLKAVGQVVLPAWVREKVRLEAALARAAGPVLQALLDWDPDGVVIDEAHRIKNAQAGRTRTCRKLIQNPGRLGLLLSGTLIRNYFDREGIPLLESLVSLDDHFRQARRAGVGKADLTRMLFQHYMIRRELKEVEPDLPDKIRVRAEVPRGDKAEPFIEEYQRQMSRADDLVYEALRDGLSLDEAKNKAMGAWSKARHALTDAKVADGYVADIVQETVEESGTGCAIVFGHHVSALDTLAEQLTAKGLRVVRAYGDVTPTKRVEAEHLFQDGTADVYIGGLLTAEGISLNRADACVHIEQDWVPGNVLQAEARAQGVGQVAPRGYLIRTCTNDYDLGDDDMDRIVAGVLARKIDGLNELYGEDESLAATITLSAGDVREVLANRSAERARARMEREGISPGAKPGTPKKKRKSKPGAEPKPNPPEPRAEPAAKPLGLSYPSYFSGRRRRPRSI